jgi:hypothetical protein
MDLYPELCLAVSVAVLSKHCSTTLPSFFPLLRERIARVSGMLEPASGPSLWDTGKSVRSGWE